MFKNHQSSSSFMTYDTTDISLLDTESILFKKRTYRGCSPYPVLTRYVFRSKEKERHNAQLSGLADDIIKIATETEIIKLHSFDFRNMAGRFVSLEIRQGELETYITEGLNEKELQVLVDRVRHGVKIRFGEKEFEELVDRVDLIVQ